MGVWKTGTWTKPCAGQESKLRQCGGLSEKCPQVLSHLDTFVNLVGGIIQGALGDAPLLEEVRKALRLKASCHCSLFCFLLAFEDVCSQLPVPATIPGSYCFLAIIIIDSKPFGIMSQKEHFLPQVAFSHGALLQQQKK